MKRLVAAALVAGALAAGTQARAETIDMSTLKCADIANWSEDQAALVMFWLHGYYGGKAEDTTVDLEALQSVAQSLGESCASEPEKGIMTVLKDLVGE